MATKEKKKLGGLYKPPGYKPIYLETNKKIHPVISQPDISPPLLEDSTKQSVMLHYHDFLT